MIDKSSQQFTELDAEGFQNSSEDIYDAVK